MKPFTDQTHLGDYAPGVEAVLKEMTQDRVIGRIWARDHTVWKPQPDEIANRLGWLTIAERMRDALPEINGFVGEVRQAGYSHALLLGMGGSSLAPEMFRKVYGVAQGHLDLSVLDSTDPGSVLHLARNLDPAKTLIIVATKSGGTVETLSGFKYFYNWLSDALGSEAAGEHFAAITDPGSGLADLAARTHFRHTFLNDPEIGGRYSALSLFGLVPAALVGVDLPRLLDRANAMAATCQNDNPVGDNPAAWLGAAIGELAAKGRDKLTFLMPEALASFGDWVEQLIAESTGKEGKGILPIVGEPPGDPAIYGPDRVFVAFDLASSAAQSAGTVALAQAGHPVIGLALDDLYDIGGQFFLWELATAVAGHRLGINPFDQPNVEAAKVLAREMVAAYIKSGALPAEEALIANADFEVYTKSRLSTAVSTGALAAFLSQAGPGAYVALQAYCQSTPEMDDALQRLRLKICQTTRLATTANYGPRFLHSTGQLHKGDAGRGLFVQFTGVDAEDAPIPTEAGKPGSSISFGVLKLAQALGDAQALRNAGRQVIRFHVKGDVPAGLKRLTDSL